MSTVSGRHAGAPLLTIDPFSPECLTDPYPSHELLREAGPIVWLEHYGVWAVGRHAEVRSVLVDWQSFCSSAGVGLTNHRREKPWRAPGLLLEADPPVHDRARKILNGILSPAAIKAMKTQFEIEAVRLVDELVERGSFDAMEDLAERFPIKVFSDAVGLPVRGREKLLPYGSLIFNAFGPHNELFRTAVAEAEAVSGLGCGKLQPQCADTRDARRPDLCLGGRGRDRTG